MGYLLLSSVLSLVALSATFAVSTAFVALLRMTALRGHDLLLCRVWKAVLIFSLIPVNISLFLPIRGHMTAIIADRISQLTQSYYTLTVGESAKNPYSGSDVVEHENGSIVLEPVKSDDARLLIDPTPYVCSSLLFVWFTAAAVKFVLPLREYAAGKKRLELYSMPLEVGHAREIFDKCAMALELHARPELMVIAGGRVCSPCVCGIFSPCVYIDAETASLSDEKLRYIFIHELSHIKLGHQQLKLLTNAVSAIHWFNPAASRCAAMVACDCELACDRNVLLRLGSNSSDRYMLTILEVARRICAVRAYTEGKTLGGGLFLSEKSDKQFMERRYANMMIMPAHKYPKLAIVSVFTVCILFSVVATASCGLPKSVTDAACSVTMVSYTTGSDLLDEGIRAYYGINFDDPITAEMLDGITTVEIRASDMLAESLEGMTNIPTFTYSDILKQKAKDGVFVEFVINGVEIDLLETAPSVSRFEGTLGKGVYEYSQSAESNSMESRYYTKWFAFYCKKDPSDPELSDADRAEMIAEYPDTLVHPAYIFDPYATVREKGLLIDIAYKSGLLDDRYLEGRVCDASSLATLHNLKTAVFTGVTPINFDETLKVRSEAEAKYIEANKLYETATDDTAYNLSLSTGSALLDEAIRAYYGINADEPINETMLSGILTLKINSDKLTAECFPADGGPLYGYAAQIREKLNAGTYVNFVINGKTIGVMETYVFGERFEGTIKTAIQKFSDTHEKAIYGTASNLWSALYGIKNASDPSLTDEMVKELVQMYPETHNHTLYVLDPYLSVRETAQMLGIAYGAGLLDGKYLPGGVFDVSVLDSLPRLISVSFEGISITGDCAVLDG